MLMNKNNNNNNNYKSKQKNSNKKITTYTNENNSPLQINLYNSKKLNNPFSDIKKYNVRKRTSSFNVTSTKMIIKNNKEIFNKFYGQKLKIKKNSLVKNNNNEDQKNINITLNKNFDQMSINSQQTLKKFSTNNVNLYKELKDIKSKYKNNKNLNEKIETKKELIVQNKNNNFLYKIKKFICFCLPN